MTRLILELGAGNDLYGEDYTKAACRAVQDALHHSSLTLFRTLNLAHGDMQVNVTIGVQHPERVDAAVVAAELPRGKAIVTVVHGGQNVTDPDSGSVSVIASAAVEACLDLNPNDWQLIPIPRNSGSAGSPKSVILWFIPVKGDLSWVHLFHFALTLMPLDYVVLHASAVITVRYDGCCHWQLFTTV